METNSKVESTSENAISDNKSVAELEKPLVNVHISEVPISIAGPEIRPRLDEEDAIRLAERLYGITTSKITELVSFDDRNFHIHVDNNIKNPIIPNAWPPGYVLKIDNSLNSNNEKYLDAQTQMMLFLRQQGIQCPKAVMNIFGKYHSLQKIGETSHLVRLLEFLPGEMFAHVPNKTHYLFYQVGELVGRIDAALKRFTHEAYDSHKTIWALEQLPELNKFLYAVGDLERQALVQQIMGEFQEKVLNQLTRFAKGVIHGDVNDFNLIVSKANETDEYRVQGIIDFGDTSYSPHVFELAIAIASMLRQSEDLETGGYVIAGYETIRPITQNERDVLKVCVAARLCQGHVMSAHSHTLDPSNDYLLLISKMGWNVLTKLWETPDVEELWFTTADNYLKQSVK